jgi:hypothetical protein
MFYPVPTVTLIAHEPAPASSSSHSSRTLLALFSHSSRTLLVTVSTFGARIADRAALTSPPTQSAPPPKPFTGGWRVELFHTPQLSSTPMAFRNLTMLASGTVQHIDMDSNIASAWAAFPRAAGLRFLGSARQIPTDGLSWRFLGRIRIQAGGDYTFCTESDDGSLLYLDLNPIRGDAGGHGAEEVYYTLLVDNDGLHSSTQRCQSVLLQPGEYHAKVGARPRPAPRPPSLRRGVHFPVPRPVPRAPLPGAAADARRRAGGAGRR